MALLGLIKLGPVLMSQKGPKDIEFFVYDELQDSVDPFWQKKRSDSDAVNRRERRKDGFAQRQEGYSEVDVGRDINLTASKPKSVSGFRPLDWLRSKTSKTKTPAPDSVEKKSGVPRLGHDDDE